ncbi:MAG TPA: hypothetical protein VMS17_08695, partial [Gemmataceae bacterium]|nr:hypothetical protein [Gemmataceae bacterium]
MATDLGRQRSAATADYESRVEGQLARAEQRIRSLDLTAALLTFFAGTLAYAVVAALLDHWLGLPPVVRQAGLIVYLLAAGAYLTAYVFMPLSRRINPYFAARKLEQTLPDAKNSVVNWLDLREQDLPPAIRGAVGQRAARAVAGADPDKAVSGRRAWTAGAVAAVCTAAFLVALFTVGFGSFFGGLSRIFSPFSATPAGGAANGLQITIVKPVDGDAVVPGDQAMDILVRVEGRAPDPKAADALMLLLHYEQSAPYQQRPLEPADAGRWGVSLPSGDIHDGFWYKVTGGGVETPEYRVRLTPRVVDFKAAYTFRPYTARAPEKRTDRRIEAWRGTQVDVTVHTNRTVQRGWLQFEGANGVTQLGGETPADDPQGFTVHLTLDESSQYRIGFTSADGENFIEPQTYPLIAVPDNPPVVTLTKPAEEKPGWVAALHEDDLLQLEGEIKDDIGVAAAHLNLLIGKVDKDDDAPLQEAQLLPPQEYRTRDAFKLPHGGNPTRVEYKDFVDLAKRKPQGVQAGLVLEYWLTAEDACDYPDPKKPNIGESKHYRARIMASLNNPQAQNQQRAQAEQEKKDAENRQDQQNKAEDQQRQDADKKNAQDNPSGGGHDNTPPKPSEKPQENGKTGDSSKNGADKDGKSTDPQKEQKKVENATDQVRKGEEGSGKSDPKEHPADAKDGGQKQQPQKPSDGKDGGGKEGAKDASQLKDKPGEQQKPAAGIDQGRPDAKQPQTGEAKAGDPKPSPEAKPGESKDGQTEAAPQPGENKDGGKPGDSKQSGDAKPQGQQPADQTAKAENKEGNPQNPMDGAGQPGEAKDKTAPETKAEARPGPDGGEKNAPKSEGKNAGQPNGMNDSKPASAKEGGEKGDQKAAAQPKQEGKAGDEKPSDGQNAKDLDDAFKKLQDDLKSKDPQK